MDDFELETQKINCKGKIYRAKLNVFINKNGEYIYQERMTPQKRLSCPGCEKCGWLVDDLTEQLLSGPVDIEDFAHGCLYELVITNISTDWETGYVDSWELKFFKVKE